MSNCGDKDRETKEGGAEQLWGKHSDRIEEHLLLGGVILKEKGKLAKRNGKKKCEKEGLRWTTGRGEEGGRSAGGPTNQWCKSSKRERKQPKTGDEKKMGDGLSLGGVDKKLSGGPKKRLQDARVWFDRK